MAGGGYAPVARPALEVGDAAVARALKRRRRGPSRQ